MLPIHPPIDRRHDDRIAVVIEWLSIIRLKDIREHRRDGVTPPFFIGLLFELLMQANRNHGIQSFGLLSVGWLGRFCHRLSPSGLGVLIMIILPL